MGAIKSGLMFTLVHGPLTRALLPPHYHFSSTISHSGAINSPPRLSEGSVTPHLTACEHHRWKGLETWTQRITSGVGCFFLWRWLLGQPFVDCICACSQRGQASVRYLPVLDCSCCFCTMSWTEQSLKNRFSPPPPAPIMISETGKLKNIKVFPV